MSSPHDPRESSDLPPAISPDFSGNAGAGLLTPEFYQHNPFRQLGVPVLAGPREILRRVDQLKLSAELGAIPGQWAFAPREALTADELRAAAQRLKNPSDRLFHELFWFWPENYPHEGPDAALEYLARDNTVQAGKLWSAAASGGDEVAWHNLAVYHHLLALEWEKDDRRDEASLAGVWQQVVHYWQHVINHEKIWDRVQERVELLDDAQLAPDAAERMRTRLPGAIAQIHAAIASEHAERGRMDRVALHTSLAGRIVDDDATRLGRVLEATARPAARRIEARVEKARAAGAARPASSLDVATTLVRECNRDLRVLEALCGTDAEYFREQQRLLAGAVLDEVVRYQRETADDGACLPLLWYLRDVAATPELAVRIIAAHTVIQANALTKETGGTPAPAENFPPDRARSFRLITEVLIPGMAQLDLTGPVRSAYAGRVAAWLKTLATEACADDEIDWAMHAMLTALDLPCDAETMADLVSTRDQLQLDFQLRRTKNLQLDFGDRRLVINARGIALDGNCVGPEAIIGLRHGWMPGEDDAIARFVVAWRSEGEEFEINESDFFSNSETAAADYAAVLEAVYFFVVPGLVERLAADLRAGKPLLLGDVQLDGAGVTLTSVNGSRFWKRTTLVPYTRVSHEADQHFLKISSLDNPKLVERVDMLQTWNAVIIGHVIDRLVSASPDPA